MRKTDDLILDVHAQHLLQNCVSSDELINAIKSETHPPKTFLLLTGELVAWWAAESLPVAPSVTDNQIN